MPRGPVIAINLKAGTAEFFAEVEKANAKILQFGKNAEASGKKAAEGQHAAVSGVQATSGALRVLEGGLTNNLRAAERFTANVLGLGPILQAAFPVIGGLAFIGLLSHMGEEVQKLYTSLRDAPARLNDAFRGANAGIKLTNDELSVANDRLENDIAKLEGHRQNTLKLALDEARVSADKLADSLDRDLKTLQKVTDDNSIGFFKSLLQLGGNRTTTTDIPKIIGGNSGSEGDIGAINKITREGQLKIDKAALAGDKGAVEKAQKELDDRLQSYINARLGYWSDELKKASPTSTGLFNKKTGAPFRNSIVDSVGDFETRTVPRKPTSAEQERIDELTKANEYYEGLSTSIQLQAKSRTDTAKKEDLTADKGNAKLDRPFERFQAEAAAQISALKSKLESIGQSESAQILAKAFGEGAKEIAKINGELDRLHSKLTPAQEAQIKSTEQTKAQTEADIQWREKLEASTVSTDGRIKSLNMLTEAIGKGYEATRVANIETRVAQELGQHADDQGFLKSHQADVAAIRARAAAELDAQHSNQTAEVVQKLKEQIALEQALARVQSEGAEAVRNAGLAVRLSQLAQEGATKEQLAAEIDLENARRQNSIASEVAKLNEQTEATERLAAATLRGAEATRQATLENKLAAIAREGDANIPGVFGIGQRGVAESGAAAASEHQRVAKIAADADPFKHINEEVADLQKARELVTDTLAIDIKLRDLENERLRIMTEQTLKMRTAGAGLKAFFLEMQQDAKSAASTIYDALNSSLDKVSDNFAKFLTGQKTNFGKAFQEIGESMIRDTLKSNLQKGLGAIGKLIHPHGAAGAAATTLDGKPSGRAGDPVHVVIDDANAGKAANPAGGILGQIPGILGTTGKGIGGFLKNLFGGGGGGIPDVTSSISFMAGGGDMTPGNVYGVAEAGEAEIVTPKNSARITPLSKLGGGDTHIHNHIDARGAALGVENRIGRAIEMAHGDAVAKSVRANHERQQRIPQKRA